MIRAVLFLFAVSIFLYPASDYDNWLKGQKGGYESYKKSLDDEFSDMLKKDWQQFRAYLGEPMYEKPKPKTLPKAVKKPKIKQVSKKVTPKKIKKVEIKKPKKVTPEKTLPKKEERPKFIVDFFGTKVEFRERPKFSFRLKEISKEEISRFWKSASRSNYKKFLEDLLGAKKSLNLNNWGLYQLVFKYAYLSFKEENVANLYSWFALTKMGFDTRIAYNESAVFLTGSLKHKLYQIPSIKIEGENYYLLTNDGKRRDVNSLYTYKENYSKNLKKFDFNVYSPFEIETKDKSKKLAFKFRGENYSFEVPYNLNLLRLYRTFPQADYEIYFDATVDPRTSYKLLNALKKEVEKRDEYEAVNFLLRFVQTAFDYKTDGDQFGFEKVMFPEETIFYSYSDCEDRSIIFSYLVENLIGLKTVGLKYKDHIATAVKFSTNIKGDSVYVGGERYVVADPTYVNADAGDAMPQYKSSSFKIVK